MPGCGIQNTSATTVEKCKSETEDKVRMDLQQLDLTYLDLVGASLGHFDVFLGAGALPAMPWG